MRLERSADGDQPRRERIQRTMWGGFAAILMLQAVIGSAQFGQVNQFFSLIHDSRYASDKAELLTAMVETARNRAHLTLQLLATEDAFDRDAIRQQLAERASNFVATRERLEALGLTHNEQQMLDEVLALVRRTVVDLQRAIELALSDDPLQQRAARRLAIVTLLPQQEQVVDQLIRLVERQRAITRDHTLLAQSLFTDAAYLTILFTLVTLALTVLVAMFVSRRSAGAARALQREKERALVTLGSIGDAVIATDALGRVQYMNPAAEQLTGRVMATVLNRPIGKVFPAREEPSGRLVSQIVHALGQYGHPDHPGEDVVMRHTDGRELHVALTMAPIREPSGRVEGVILSFQDVTEARRQARRVAFEAQHDVLTGLLNRRAFQTRVEQVLDLYPANQHVLCVLDLDRFKLVNDTGGHAAGDALLRQLTAQIRSMVRQGDLVARLGGDEFALFLTNTPLDTARKVAEKLLNAVRDHRLLWHGHTFRVGVSVGLVATPDQAQATYQRLILAADVGCYQAKSAGRDRLCVVDYDAAPQGGLVPSAGRPREPQGGDERIARLTPPEASA